MDENTRSQIQELAAKLEQIELALSSAQKLLNKLENNYLKVDYTQIDGIVGSYDGKYLTTKDGSKYEVPANYAAKSKLVFGDVLKMIEENGKQLFKQIEKVRKERVEGILTKKDGEWFLLTDRGSYKVLEAAALYHNAQLNSQATAYLPADNMDAPFAALDAVEGLSVVAPKVSSEPKPIERESKPEIKEKKPFRKEPARKDEEDLRKMPARELDLKKSTEKPTIKHEPSAGGRPSSRKYEHPPRKPKLPAEIKRAEPKETAGGGESVRPARAVSIDDDDLV